MRRILAAVDSSDMADLVLTRAIELVRASPAKLRLLRVVPIVAERPAPGLVAPGGDTRALVAAAEADLLRREAAVPEEHRDGVVIVMGRPWEQICKVARDYDADTVVIGAHRYGVVERILGTTAARVADHLDRPLVIVRPVARTRKKPATANGLPGEGVALREIAAIAGAASGAAAGAIAGPPGAIIGGVLGTAVGMMAGSTLDAASNRAAAHDRELDAAIGVTEGDLGAREQAVAGLNAVERAEASGTIRLEPELVSAAELLRREHARLEDVYAMLLSAYREGDWTDVHAHWQVFERALKAHMALEEREIFPAFRAANAEETSTLLAEHDELRSMLEVLGINIELHAVTERDALTLVQRLRAHGEREERLLYPWIDATLDAGAIARLQRPAATRAA